MLEVLLQTPVARRLSQLFFAPNETLHAPHLIDLEIAQVMRRYTRSGEISAERAGEVLSDLCDIPLIRYPHSVLLKRIWELRNGLTAYDAAYVALAEALDVPLITRDRALAKGGGRARVEVI